MRSLIPYLFFPILLCGDPWGKDADLVNFQKDSARPPENYQCPTPILGTVADKIITFHQEVISPADGPRSHYIPSSSQYMRNAIRKYGFAQGFSMGCDRLMRENDDPWVYRDTLDGAGVRIKYDPVP